MSVNKGWVVLRVSGGESDYHRPFEEFLMLTSQELEKYGRVADDGSEYFNYEQYWLDKETRETLDLIERGLKDKLQMSKNRVNLQKLIRTVFKGRIYD